MTDTFRQFITILLEPISCIFLFIAFLLRLGVSRQKKIAVLAVYYFLASAGFMYASHIVFASGNNNWIYNTLYIPELAAIAFYFHQTFLTRRNKQIAIGIILIHLLYFGLRMVPPTRLFIFDSWGYSGLSISVCILSFIYFLQLLRNVNEHTLWSNFDFWVVSSFLLNFLGSFFIFLLYANLPYSGEEQRHLLAVLWGVHNVLLFLSAIIVLASSIWITYQNKSR